MPVNVRVGGRNRKHQESCSKQERFHAQGKQERFHAQGKQEVTTPLARQSSSVQHWWLSWFSIVRTQWSTQKTKSWNSSRQVSVVLLLLSTLAVQAAVSEESRKKPNTISAAVPRYCDGETAIVFQIWETLDVYFLNNNGCES
jgi:hypothetical protein